MMQVVKEGMGVKSRNQRLRGNECGCVVVAAPTTGGGRDWLLFPLDFAFARSFFFQLNFNFFRCSVEEWAKDSIDFWGRPYS